MKNETCIRCGYTAELGRAKRAMLLVDKHVQDEGHCHSPGEAVQLVAA